MKIFSMSVIAIKRWGGGGWEVEEFYFIDVEPMLGKNFFGA